MALRRAREVKHCGRRRRETRKSGPCVLKADAVIRRVWMLPALCADRDNGLLLSRSLIGLFTSYNWEKREGDSAASETQHNDFY